jgi:hypothetical protein
MMKLPRKMRAAPEPAIRMAKSISVAVCEHGSLYIRLHDVNGMIFAAASMDRDTGFSLADDILDELIPPSLKCEGMH